ncbi:hypothetical protein DFH07DRAFT_975156, partial [Mycena maculata]
PGANLASCCRDPPRIPNSQHIRVRYTEYALHFSAVLAPCASSLPRRPLRSALHTYAVAPRSRRLRSQPIGCILHLIARVHSNSFRSTGRPARRPSPTSTSSVSAEEGVTSANGAFPCFPFPPFIFLRPSASASAVTAVEMYATVKVDHGPPARASAPPAASYLHRRPLLTRFRMQTLPLARLWRYTILATARHLCVLSRASTYSAPARCTPSTRRWRGLEDRIARAPAAVISLVIPRFSRARWTTCGGLSRGVGASCTWGGHICCTGDSCVLGWRRCRYASRARRNRPVSKCRSIRQGILLNTR